MRTVFFLEKSTPSNIYCKTFFSGIVLFATSEARRKHLKQMIAARKIVKMYYAITNGIPTTREGIVNIPISEGKVDGRFRPTVRPDYDASQILNNKSTYRGPVR